MMSRDLKRRIGVVEETGKIVSAMQMIASSKMRRATAEVEASANYLDTLHAITKNLVNAQTEGSKLYSSTNESKIAYIVLSGDSGLCGDFNHLILNSVARDIIEKDVKTLFPIGRLGNDYFSGSSFKVDSSFVDFGTKPNENNAKAVAEKVLQGFLCDEFDCVQLAYTDSKKVASQKINIIRLLPFEKSKGENLFEFLYGFDGVEGILKECLIATIYYAMCSSTLAMNYKKLVTMRQASSNSEQMLDALKKKYNHERQEKITTELLDSAISLQGKKL